MITFYALRKYTNRGIIYATHQYVVEERESTGMNRKEFCDYFQIPYRTVTDWERGNRHAPEYVLRLLEYFIRMEGMSKIRVDSD